jgi:hypothetical protein
MVALIRPNRNLRGSRLKAEFRELELPGASLAPGDEARL